MKSMFDGMRGMGSPPRVRGKAPSSTTQPMPCGITPARAGKRILSMFLIVSVRDHPRACGGKMNNKLICGKREGSPPRVR